MFKIHSDLNLHFIVKLFFLDRPEKSKLQIIPGQLNVTIECVPPDFSSMSSFGYNLNPNAVCPFVRVGI